LLFDELTLALASIRNMFKFDFILDTF